MGEVGDPLHHIFLFCLLLQNGRPSTSHRLPIPIYKIVSYAPRGVKGEPRDGRLINHLAFSFPSPHDGVGFLFLHTFLSLFFWIFLFPPFTLSRPTSPCYFLVIFFNCFFFLSLSLTWWNWLRGSLSLGAGLGVPLQPWLSAANNKQEQQTSWFVSVRPVWTGQRQLAAIHLENNNKTTCCHPFFFSSIFFPSYQKLEGETKLSGRWWGLLFAPIVCYKC